MPVQRNFLFSAYGVNFSSCLFFPEFIQTDHKIIDVNISYGLTPTTLLDPQLDRQWCEIGCNQFLLRIEGVANYFVDQGSHIVIQPTAMVEEHLIRFYLLGIVMGMLLHQRKFLVLHGSAIKINNACVIFVAPSGVGKSTLATAFAKKGFSLLADDLAAIRIDSTGDPLLIPGISHIKLSEESTEKLQICAQKLKPLFPHQKKYVLPIDSQLLNQPVTIQHIYELSISEHNVFSQTVIQGAAKFDRIRCHTFKDWAIAALGIQTRHFQQVHALSRQVSVTKIARPVDSFQLDALVDFLISTFVKQSCSANNSLNG